LPSITLLHLAQTAGELPWQTLLGPWGLTAFLLLAVVYGGRKRWWVFGWQYEEKSREAEFYRNIAFRTTNVAEAATSAAERLTGQDLEELADIVDEARRKGEIR
jgi:hypothetical protein